MEGSNEVRSGRGSAESEGVERGGGGGQKGERDH